jgi:hypothetical protein
MVLYGFFFTKSLEAVPLAQYELIFPWPRHGPLATGFEVILNRIAPGAVN